MHVAVYITQLKIAKTLLEECYICEWTTCIIAHQIKMLIIHSIFIFRLGTLAYSMRKHVQNPVLSGANDYHEKRTEF